MLDVRVVGECNDVMKWIRMMTDYDEVDEMSSLHETE